MDFPNSRFPSLSRLSATFILPNKPPLLLQRMRSWIWSFEREYIALLAFQMNIQLILHAYSVLYFSKSFSS